MSRLYICAALIALAGCASSPSLVCDEDGCISATVEYN